MDFWKLNTYYQINSHESGGTVSMNNKIRLNQVASHFKYRVGTAKFERGRKMKIRKLAWLLVQKIFFFFFFPPAVEWWWIFHESGCTCCENSMLHMRHNSKTGDLLFMHPLPQHREVGCFVGCLCCLSGEMGSKQPPQSYQQHRLWIKAFMHT